MYESETVLVSKFPDPQYMEEQQKDRNLETR